jgi:hypothetical protein
MKYIKMFEDFGSDMMDEARYILVSHLGEVEEIDFIGGDFGFNHQVEMSDRLRQRIRVFRLQESPNVRDLAGFEEHMREETEGIFWNVNLDWYSGKVAILCEGDSIESLLGEWLKERFSDLTLDRNFLTNVVYREKNGSAVFFYKKNNVSNMQWPGTIEKIAYVSYDSIWGFFRTILCLEESQIRKILHDWLLQSFGLDLEPKKW